MPGDPDAVAARAGVAPDAAGVARDEEPGTPGCGAAAEPVRVRPGEQFDGRSGNSRQHRVADRAAALRPRAPLAAHGPRQLRVARSERRGPVDGLQGRRRGVLAGDDGPQQIPDGAAKLDQPAPRLAAWLPAAVDPDHASYIQLMRSVVGYFPVRGYREVFERAGFGAAIALAEVGAEPDDVLQALPEDAARTVGLVGDVDTIRARLAEYSDAGLDEVAILPATAGDPAGERTLSALAPRRAD